MFTVKGGIPKARGKSNAYVFGAASAALAVGLAISPTGQAASITDLPDKAGNTVQVNADGDVIQPQFALWPLTGPNNSVIRYDSNEADGRGSDATRGPVGLIAGNVIQISTGGNVTNPQVAIFTDNNSDIQTYGNWAIGNGTNDQSVTGGQVLGHVIDANGNVFQMEFLQGNVINPQFAFMGDNTSTIRTRGNYAEDNGGDTAGALAFVDANGNVVQIMILSHNVINPQVSVGGSNDLTILATGNTAVDNGGDVHATGFAGIFAVTKVGNVTQIAILSNNVWAPQIVLPGLDGSGGSNTGHIISDTNDAEADGIDVDIDTNTPPGQIDVGNIHQWAPFGNGNISNNQWNFANHSTPDVVQEEEPPGDPAPALAGNDLADQDKDNLVRESFVAEPGVILTGDNNSGGGNSSVKGNWKPGDGIKKVVAGVKKVVHDVRDALTPKPKPESESEPSPE